VANHASARKRYRQSLKVKASNHSVRSRIRTLIRSCREAIAAGDADHAHRSLTDASTALAKAASKGILHHRNAARRTSRLARQVGTLTR